MTFTLYSTDSINTPSNCIYPNKTEVTDSTSLANAVSHDYVCAEYLNSYRSNDNFLSADCLPVDCDNDHSENPSDWVTPDDVQKAFPKVSFAVHYSRFNMREKNGNMDIWLSAVDNFFCKDADLIDYVQQTVGLAAIGKVYQEALIIAYGEGSNGKSTFWNAIARVLGSYSGTMSADALTVGCKRNVKPEMAELKGKRLVIAAELEEGMRLNTSIVKQLCSTDEVTAEKKYKDPFKYIPTHTLVLYTNHLPKVGANDDGTWRRLIVIPFNAKIKGKSDIKNYADYLVEKSGGAVLMWIIEGAKKVIENNLVCFE